MWRARADVTYLLRQHFQRHQFQVCYLQSPWSTAGGNTQPSVHFCFSGLLTRPFEPSHTDDQIYPKPVYLLLSIWDRDQDPKQEKPMLMTKILRPYWFKDKVMESLHVAAAERYARLQWAHSLIPMCHRGSAQQFDVSSGNVAVKSSEGKTYTAWKEDFLRCERQKTWGVKMISSSLLSLTFRSHLLWETLLSVIQWHHPKIWGT